MLFYIITTVIFISSLFLLAKITLRGRKVLSFLLFWAFFMLMIGYPSFEAIDQLLFGGLLLGILFWFIAISFWGLVLKHNPQWPATLRFKERRGEVHYD